MSCPADRIALARAKLVEAGIPTPDAAFDAELLARHALGWDRAALLIHGREPSPPHFDSIYDELVARRVQREPVAQILGLREFWGLDFEVTPDVLVPRPETELIVEEALAFARQHRCHTALDIGTGSGCIAIALASELAELRVTAIDRSEAALAVARRNAARHNLSDRLTFGCGDLFDGFSGSVDLIVSNPPYVPVGEASSLQPEVIGFEPHGALFAGADGLEVIGRLLRAAPPYLANDGRLIVEFGQGQRQAFIGLAEGSGWTVDRIGEDLQGIPRTAVLRR